MPDLITPKRSIVIPAYWLWLLAIIGFAILLKARFIGIPFERDEGAYAYYGRLILQGGIPYIDFQAMKLPGLFYSYAFIQWLTGDTASGLQVGFLAWHIMVVIFFFDSIRRLFTPNTALLGTLFFVLWSINRDMSGFTAQSEHLLVGYMVLAFWCILKANGKAYWFWLLLSGALAAMAFQVKQTAAFLILFLGLFVVLRHWLAEARSLGRGFIQGTLLTVGFAAIIALGAIYMVFQGSFDEFRYWVFEFSAAYVSKISPEVGWRNLRYNAGNIFGFSIPLTLLALAGLAMPLVFKEGWKSVIALLGFLVLSFLAVAPGYRFMGHYWLQMVPVLALLSAFGVEVLSALLLSNVRFPKKATIPVIAAVAVGITLAIQWPYFYSATHTEVLRQKYTYNPFPEAKVIADYVKRNSKPDDKIVVIGSEPQIYYYANRHCASQFKYFEHLVKGTERSNEMQQQFMREIEETLPRYLVFLRHSVSWNAAANTTDNLIAWSNRMFNEYYILEGVVDILPQTHYEFANPSTYKPRSSLFIYIMRLRDNY